MARNYARNRCRVCRGPLPADRHFGDCETCKALSRQITQAHKAGRPPCRADDPERAVRAEVYAAMVERGGRLFE